VEFFGSYVNRREFQASSVAAVLLVRAGGRFFALTFGHGRHLLDPASYEEGFGLRVTLNSVTPERIRTIDRKALDATGRHLREQASRNIPIIEFGLDIDKDILCAVMGPPEDSRLGKRLAGADALSVVVEVELASLRDKLQAYLAQYLKEDYRERFPWVDNIREVRDPTVSDELDGELVKRIRERRLERVWLAAPELLDWRDVAGFTYGREQEPPYLDDINFESYLDHVRDPGEISPEMLRRHRVFCISVETDSPREHWSLYRCIHAEIDRRGGTYLLNAGKWYQVSNEYVRAVNEAVARIPSSNAICFPEYNDPSETDYNARMHHSNPAVFALMDGKTVRYGGGSVDVLRLVEN
jgi:uncharacterized protein (TIGR04141 family)